MNYTPKDCDVNRNREGEDEPLPFYLSILVIGVVNAALWLLLWLVLN